MTNDPIADFLTRVRNAQMARKTSLVCPYSTVKHAIAVVMQKNGFLTSVTKDESGKFPMLSVEIPEKKMTLKRVSKPGQRIYIKSDEIRKVKNGYGIAVISTPEGVMTGYEARARKMGGEYLCEIS